MEVAECCAIHVNAKVSVERCEHFLEVNRAFFGMLGEVVRSTNDSTVTDSAT